MTPERYPRVVPDFPELQKFPVTTWIRTYVTCFGIIFGPFSIFLVMLYVIWKVIRR